MAYYHPCKNCAVNHLDCDRRSEIQRAISGLSVTSIKFKCDIRKPRFCEGERVSFRWRYFMGEQISQDDFDAEEILLSFAGTVIREAQRNLRFTVRVDRHQESNDLTPSDVFRNDSLVINVKPDDMTPTGEAARIFCPNCLAYDAEEAKNRCHGYKGGAWWDLYHPEGCLVDRKDLK